jgi:CubicO group peptidase (beta-lactamase class C family)
VEKITKQTLGAYEQANIFRPLGMTRTGYIWHPAFENDYANGYDEKGDSIRKKKRSTANAAGSMETTIADYTRFMAAVNQGWSLSAKTFHEMLSPQIFIHSAHPFPSLSTDTSSANDRIHLSYGLGWGLFDTPSGTAFFKEGHDDGWVHYSMGMPSTGRAGDHATLQTAKEFSRNSLKQLPESLSPGNGKDIFYNLKKNNP